MNLIIKFLKSCILTETSRTIQYNNTIQYTIQYNTIQYNTIYNTIQYNTIQYNTIQYNTTIQYNKAFIKRPSKHHSAEQKNKYKCKNKQNVILKYG